MTRLDFKVTQQMDDVIKGDSKNMTHTYPDMAKTNDRKEKQEESVSS